MIFQSRETRPAFFARLFSTVILCVLAFFLPSGYSSYAPAQTCAQPPSGIIAWWTFDETSGTTAGDIVGNSPGVHVNGPVPTVGQVAGSLRFDGADDYVGVGDSDRWALGRNDFTIEMWANFSSPGGGTISHPGDIFIGNDEGPFTVNKWFFALGGGVLEFVFSGPTIGDQFLTFAPFAPNLNQWYHLAIRRQGDTFTAFVNGLPSGSVINTAAIPNPNAPLTIGQAEELGFMNGQLDEVAIYDRALTQSELQAIFNAGNAGKCKALSISTKALSAIQLGTFSTQKLEAFFGSAPFSWSLVNGALPLGMTLTSDGVLSGTPTVAGSFPVTIRVTDSLNAIAEKNFVLDVLLVPPPKDIRIHKTGMLAVPGRTVDYFIVVENVGNLTATDVAVLEVINPSHFTLLSVNPQAVTDEPALADASVIIWSIPSLVPGEIKILTYQAQIKPSVPIGTRVIGGRAYVNLDQLRALQCLAVLVPTTVQCAACPFECTAAVGGCIDFPLACPALVANCIACWVHCGHWFDLAGEICADHSSDASDAHEQNARGAIDPNEKTVAAKTFIQPDQLLVYPIHFENIGDIEARDVFVTDVLDPNLDVSMLNLLTPTGGSLDVATRTVRWNLLNRNLGPGQTGNVLLSIRPRPGLPSGTVIRNNATIQFEVFQPLVTNEVVNIIDSTRPTSAMNPLPAETSTLDFPISWSGSDAVGEIDFYSIFVSVDGGAFTPFLERTRNTSATFRGEPGRTYGFLSIATDTAGNIEVQNAIAEASTEIIANCATGADNQPPTITGESAIPSVLWPPNHRMVEVTVNYNVTDNCGPLTCMLNVSSNEPINGTGDGDAAPDWEIVDAHHVRLRAERARSAFGRIYTITIICSDISGNSSSRSVTVRVPNNQGQN